MLTVGRRNSDIGPRPREERDGEVQRGEMEKERKKKRERVREWERE